MSNPTSIESVPVCSSVDTSNATSKAIVSKEQSNRSQETKEMNYVDGGSSAKAGSLKKEASQAKSQERQPNKPPQKNNGKNKVRTVVLKFIMCEDFTNVYYFD